MYIQCKSNSILSMIQGEWTLNSNEFANMLFEEIQSPSGMSTKHILQFHNRQTYRACVSRLKQLNRGKKKVQSYQDLHIINAISCPLNVHSAVLHCPQVKSAEEDKKVRIRAFPMRSTAASEGALSSSFMYKGSQMIPWGIKQIKAPLAWKKTLGGQIKIGVIDTGIDFMHPDLKSSIGNGLNLLFPGALPIDDNGHGTHIAGIIAGSSKSQGILGVAPKASIHAVKAFDMVGSAYVSDIIAGINWCVENKMDIINMSFGMSTYSRALEKAVKNAYDAGKIIVASCGNEGKKQSIDYPARFEQVVSVGATTRTGKVASFSNKGKRIDVYAPGEKIFSSWLYGRYNELNGTSMATAHVTGVIALMMSTKPNLKPSQVKQLLKRSSISITNGKTSKLPGQINARRAISILKKSSS